MKKIKIIKLTNKIVTSPDYPKFLKKIEEYLQKNSKTLVKRLKGNS